MATNMNPVLAAAGAGQEEEAGLDTAALASQVEQALSGVATAATAYKKEVTNAVPATRAAQDTIRQSTQTIIAADQTAALAKDTAALQLQNTTNELLAAAGGTEEQIRLMTELTTDGQRVEGLLDKQADIMDDEFTGLHIIDNVINKFRAVPTELQLGIAEKQQQQTVTQIQNTSAAQEYFASTNSKAAKTLNQAVIAENQRKIAAQGAAGLAKQELENIQSNADSLYATMQADSTVASALQSQYAMRTGAEDRALRAEQLALQQEELQVRREAILKGDADEAATKQFEAGRTLAVQRAQALMGSPVESMEEINWKFNNASTRDSYIELDNIGSRPTLAYADNPADAYITKNAYDPSGSASTKGSAVLSQVAQIQSASYVTSPTGAPKDEETLKADFNSTASTFMSSSAGEIKSGDRTNPYQAPTMEILSQYRTVETSSLYQGVLADQKMTEVMPQRIVDLAVAAVKAKTIGSDEAVDGILKLFNSAALYNNTNEGGFERAGLGQYNQTGYKTSIATPVTPSEQLKATVSVFTPTGLLTQAAGIVTGSYHTLADAYKQNLTTSQIVDLTNATEVQSLITKLLMSNTLEDNASNTIPNTGE